MKVVRTSTRLVKPEGAPLPHPHPAHAGSCIPLSNSDLVVACVHVEVLYAFHGPALPTPLLESGLAKVLAQYREWAGRLGTDDRTGRPAVHLTDDGAALVEAQAHGPLDDLVPFNPSFQLLDLIPTSRGVPELLLIQLTRFTCGGMTIGVARHHQVADGEAASDFMDAWALIVRGLPVPFSPLHDRSALMARNPPCPDFKHIEYQQRPAPKLAADAPGKLYPKLAVKKLCFSVELLKKIKAQAAKGASEGVRYTTFESLLAHLWRCITKARGLENEEGETRALVAVNARKRLNPPLPKEYFGNVICHTCPQATIKELLAQPLSFAANLVHAAIKKVTSDYVRSAFDFVEVQQKNHVQIAKTQRTVLTPDLSVTSWVNLPLYKLDFGFGTPMFAGNPFIPFEGLVILGPTTDGSIDVVLGLFTPDMAKLEAICYHLDE